MHAPLQVPLGLSLPHNLKQKTINEEFVEFYSLPQENPTETLTLNLIQNGEGQTLSISSGRQKTKQISDFQTRLKVFLNLCCCIWPPSPISNSWFDEIFC